MSRGKEKAADPEAGRTAPEPASPAGRRIRELDALRGFALCGIIFINIGQVMEMTDVPPFLSEFVRYHFFPIFSVLFGLGFGIFLHAARATASAPRRALLYRLTALAALGAAHGLLQPGEVLAPYALSGVAFLLPASYLPAAALPIPAAAALAGGFAFGGGVYALIPGLLLTGYLLAARGVHERIPRRPAGILSAALVAGTLAALAYYLAAAGSEALHSLVEERNLGALLTAAAYSLALVAALKTPAGAVLGPVLEPLGKMALTNYVSATLVFVPAGHLLELQGSSDWRVAIALGAAILCAQAVSSALWLARFRYGPLEWAWRCATWQEKVALRKASRPSQNEG